MSTASTDFGELWDAYVVAAASAPNEDSLKHPLQTLVEGVGQLYGIPITTDTEADGVDGARPDIAIMRTDGAQPELLGWVELKKLYKRLPGLHGYTKNGEGQVRGWDINAGDFRDGSAPTKHDTEQWEVLGELPNLLYCNGLGLARYESGQLVDSTDSDALEEPIEPTLSTEDIRAGFERMLRDCIRWEPTPPRTMRQLAAGLAPLTRLLKIRLVAALKAGDSGTLRNKAAWTTALISGASDDDFADGYAQAVVFAVLFARLDGAAAPLSLESIRQTIEAEHSLLYQVVKQLGDAGGDPGINDAMHHVFRYVGVVDNEHLKRRDENPWHDFYEYFVDQYDPARRNDTGVYFTPKAIVDLQVEQCHEALLDMGFADSFASEGVQVIDPATGSGTYLLSVIERTREHLLDRYGPGIGDHPDFARQLGRNIHAMEIGVGAYSIAQLRIGRALADMAGQTNAEAVNVYLANTLSDPWADQDDESQLKLFLHELADEQDKANQVKRSPAVRVILGNPPYDREESADGPGVATSGSWVRWEARGPAGDPASEPLMEDFYRGSRDLGFGKEAAKSLPNLYIYFWRWAMWKAFEQHDKPAIVSFVCPTGFLTGRGATGMRAWMRTHADEIVTIDLLGSRRDARRTYNIFTQIKTPVGITTARRTTNGPSENLAPWPRIVFRGTLDERLQQLRDWTEQGPTALAAPYVAADDVAAAHDDVLTPAGAQFRKLPALTDIVGFHRKGVQAQRMWVYAETETLALARWAKLVGLAPADPDDPRTVAETRDKLLGSNGSNTAADSPRPLLSGAEPLPPLADLPAEAKPEAIVKVQYRPLDTHYLVADARVLGRPSPDLWGTRHTDQMYLVSRFVTEGAGSGPVSLLTPFIPDLDCSNPINGGRADVAPLYRSNNTSTPNVHPDLTAKLSSAYGTTVTAADVFWYVNGLMGTGAYSRYFWDELEMSVPRVALPDDPNVFDRLVNLGRHVAWITTGGTIGSPLDGFDADNHPITTRAVEHPESGSMPTRWTYNPDNGDLTVEGRVVIENVPEAVMQFQYMGKRVVESWLDYRKKARKRGGRAKTTPLDDMRPDWSPQEFSLPLRDLTIAVHRLIESETTATELIDAATDAPLKITLRALEPRERQPLITTPEQLI